jgi:hypothetical protein
MGNSESKWKTRLENIKNIFEIIAIISAGFWVLFSYVIRDSPKLYQKTLFNAEMCIDSIDKEHVHVEFLAHIKNSGKKTFECDSVSIKYWLIDLDSLKLIPYFSIDSYLMDHDPLGTYTDLSLNGIYPIEQEYYQVYNFFLKKDPFKMIVIQAHAFLKYNTILGKEYFDEAFYNYKVRCIPDTKI